MDSYVDNYLGEWEDERGNHLAIRRGDDESTLVSFFTPPAGQPILRPWHRDEPSVNMLGIYDAKEGPELVVELAEPDGRFTLHLNFEPAYALDAHRRDALVPALSRYEEDGFLEQYYGFFHPLEHYTRCRSRGTC